MNDNYLNLEAHRGWHKCRGQECETAKELRGLWVDTAPGYGLSLQVELDKHKNPLTGE